MDVVRKRISHARKNESLCLKAEVEVTLGELVINSPLSRLIRPEKITRAQNPPPKMSKNPINKRKIQIPKTDFQNGKTVQSRSS
jgi:hypothetical protein